MDFTRARSAGVALVNQWSIIVIPKSRNFLFCFFEWLKSIKLGMTPRLSMNWFLIFDKRLILKSEDVANSLVMSSVIGHGQNILTPIYAQEYVQKSHNNHKHSFLRIHLSFLSHFAFIYGQPGQNWFDMDSKYLRDIINYSLFHVWTNVLTALKQTRGHPLKYRNLTTYPIQIRQI